MEFVNKYLKNYYAVLTVVFLVWLSIFDKNDFLSQYKLTKIVNGLQDQKEFYLSKIDVVEEERNELMNNTSLLEKFAREKYLMKKESEDIYVVQFEE